MTTGVVRGVVRAGWALCRPGHSPVRGPTEIIVANGRIETINQIPAESLSPAEAGLLLMPAPSNAHDHGRGLRTLAYGAADAPLETWLPALAREPRVDPYVNATVAFARMARAGVCAANHCHNTQDGAQLLAEAEGVSRAARDVGIRIAFALPFNDRNPYVYGDLDKLLGRLEPGDREIVAARVNAMRALSTNMDLIEAMAGLEHENFRLQYGPLAPQWATTETLAGIADASAQTGRRVHMHLLETERQREWADATYPGGLIRFLDSIGLITPRLTVAHAVWLRADECALLAERGATVSINLSSNLRLRSGQPSLHMIRAAGLSFAIGLDGMSLDDDEDFLRELRMVWHMFSRSNANETPMTPAEIFDAAICAGRRTILGDDGGGQIAIGAIADVLALDFAAMTRDCVNEDISVIDMLLGRMSARHVVRLLVGGREVVSGGRCVTVDLDGLEDQLSATARAAMRTNPPDLDRISRFQDGVAHFYRCGSHMKGKAP